MNDNNHNSNKLTSSNTQSLEVPFINIFSRQSHNDEQRSQNNRNNTAIDPNAIDQQPPHKRRRLDFSSIPLAFSNRDDGFIMNRDGLIMNIEEFENNSRALLKDKLESHRFMQDAANWRIGDPLLQLFVTILLNCEDVNALKLWNEYKANMSYDIRKALIVRTVIPVGTYSKISIYKAAEIEALRKIQELLKEHNKTLNDLGLPDMDERHIIKYVYIPLAGQRCARTRGTYDQYIAKDEAFSAKHSYRQMNDEQKQTYTDIIEAIYETKGPSQHQIFFVDGLAGTGKTFVAEAILSKVRSQGQIAIAVASTSIGALSLTGGRTLHFRFNLPCEFNETTYADIRSGSALAQLIEQAKVIVWDVAPMAHRHVLECIDRTFRNIMRNHQPFGGKKLVLIGDFRQSLPVMPWATKQEVVSACLKTSELWHNIKVYHLTINERAKQNQFFWTRVLHPMEHQQDSSDFANTLEEIGDGRYPIHNELGPDMIRIPTDWLSKSETIDDFIEEAFPDFKNQYRHNHYLRNRAILTPRNKDAETINQAILKKLPTKEEGPILSYDELQDEDRKRYLHEEDLNHLHPATLPQHKLYLKKNAVIMLLRNINPAQGACNGTRLKVMAFNCYVIKAVILEGLKRNKTIFIPRIKFYADKTSPIPFTRTQFPVKLAYAMTINKAQGQTLHFMGLYLPKPVFSHGQLYTACSRVESKYDLSIYIIDGKNQGIFDGHKGVFTRNIVYKEVFNFNNNNEESTEKELTDNDSNIPTVNPTIPLPMLTPAALPTDEEFTDNDSNISTDEEFTDNDSESDDDDITIGISETQNNSESSNDRLLLTNPINSVHQLMTPEQRRRQTAYDKSEMCD